MLIKKIIAVLACSLLLGCSGKNFQPFTSQDMSANVVLTGLIILDGIYTNDARNHDGVWEKNPLLSPQPTKNEVVVYFPLAILANTFVVWWLPKDWRAYWQAGWIATEIKCAIVNDNNGLL